MEFGFRPAQDIVRTSVRKFMKNEAPLTHARAMEDNPDGFSPNLWHKIAKLGWIGLDYPKEYGGFGGSFTDVAIICEEMGRAMFPSPYLATAVLAGHCLLAAGSGQQKSETLPGIARGEAIATIALTEPSGTYDASGIQTTAVRGPDGRYRLNGIKLLVPFAHAANRIIVAARTNSRALAEDGISLFLIDPRSSGVAILPVRIISQEKQSEIVLQDVEAEEDCALGALDGGWPVIKEVLDKGKVAMSAEMVGGAQAVLDMAIAYAKERRQFGQPIGGFQVIKHRLAELATQIEGARWLTYRAAGEIAEGRTGEVSAALAKAYISDVYVRAARAAVQIYGGYGYMVECDVQLYFRRAKAAEVLLGDQGYNRELAAREMGL